jgi:hypothetical protein
MAITYFSSGAINQTFLFSMINVFTIGITLLVIQFGFITRIMPFMIMMMVPMTHAVSPILGVVFNIPHNFLNDKKQYNANCMK